MSEAPCDLCNNPMPLDELWGHLSEVHGKPVDIETWPDGDPVVVDHTLTPEDF